MDFVRRHLFYILCGLAAAGGIALAVTGMGAMPAVRAEMDKAQKLYRDLDTLQTTPVNQAVIADRRQRIDSIKGERAAVGEKAKELQPYRPLIDGVFPGGDANARREFRKAYAAEMKRLWESLRCGEPAAEADVAAMRDRIDEEIHRKKLSEDPSSPAPKSDAAPPATTPAGVLTVDGARGDAVARAHIAAAQRIYCYGVSWETAKPPERESSLRFHPKMVDQGAVTPPELADIWEAQVGLWLQTDVVNAIVAVNEEAAQGAKERNEDRWVGMMPVKEVISIRPATDLYVKSDEAKYVGAAPGGYGAALPPGTGNTVFTQSVSGEFYEVAQFTLKLIMDQRDIPRLIERLSERSFHTLLRVSYRAIEPNVSMKGKIYGPEPVVNVVMDFETIMLGDVFRSWMPAEVCEEYTIACPKAPDSDASAKGAGKDG